jgi:hypothetical protein
MVKSSMQKKHLEIKNANLNKNMDIMMKFKNYLPNI